MEILKKTYVVTGATSGIGLASAAALVRAGCDVIGVGRSADRCRQAEKALSGMNPAARVHYLAADLSQQSEVRRLAALIKDCLAADGKAALDGLVNNAGVYTYWLMLTPDGIEMQWAVNHLAGFLLTHELLPLLQAAPYARVVTVSSDSHHGARIRWDDPQLRRCYDGLAAYGTTKLANILFTVELNRRLGESCSVRAFAVDPGLVKTDIAMKGTPPLVSWAWRIRRSGGTGPEVPARCIQYLLMEPTIQHAPQQYWKNCRSARASRTALDGQSAARLWSLSERLCGMTKRSR